MRVLQIEYQSKKSNDNFVSKITTCKFEQQYCELNDNFFLIE